MSENQLSTGESKVQTKFPAKHCSRLILLFVLISFYISSGPKIASTQSESDLDSQVNEIIESMTLEEKVGQLFMVYWSGTNVVTLSLEELISDFKVGSVYVSGSNFVNSVTPTAAEQVAALTNQLQTYNWENNKITRSSGDQLFLPLFLAADHEGDGPRYTRIRTGMTPIPSQLSVGATWSTENAEDIGYVVGSELGAIGINMLLGPVLDVVDNPSVSAAGNLDVRVFGGDPQWVGEMGRAYIRGVHLGSNRTVITVAKHFPGHGDSDRATDQTVAITNKSLSELLDIDLVPFLRVTDSDGEDDIGVTDAIMSSHIAIAATGREPISLYFDVNDQRGGLVQLLEDVEGFNEWYSNGFIVSDSLGVGAIKRDHGSNFPHVKIATDAFLAGNDLLILHNFVPFYVQYSDPNLQDADAHQRIKDVISHFQERYENDSRFKERIDNAVRKIVRAKLRLYPELTIDSVLVDQEEVLDRTGTEANYSIIADIAEESVTLLKPEISVNLPPPPERNDNVVFVVHNFDIFPCEICGEEWLQQIQDSFAEFLINDRQFIRENIKTYYFYRKDPSDPAGISTFLYGYFPGVDHTLSPISDDEVEEILRTLENADWIIFIFAAGDCGPDAYKTDSTRCQRGRPEADTLHRFLQYVQNADLEAKIAALSFGAPPWMLDATDAGLLDVYYGVFSQIEVFQRSAARALLREYSPSGDSPIDVSAIGYDLEEILVPSSSQSLELQIVDESNDSTWSVGDEVDLFVTGIIDKNGNPLIDNTSVDWIGIYETGVRLVPDPSSNRTVDYGETKASFTLTQEGQITFSARIGEIESEQLTILVQEWLTPTSVREASSTPTSEDSLALVVATKQSATLVPESSTEEIQEEAPLEPTSMVDPDEPVRWTSRIIWAVVILIVVAFTLVVFSRLTRRTASIKRPQTESAENNDTLEDSSLLVPLVDKIDKHFNVDELEDLCLRLNNVDYENLGGEGKKGKVRKLVEYMKRHNRIEELLTLLKELRPKVSWG